MPYKSVKKCDDTSILLHRVPALDEQTDGQNW